MENLLESHGASPRVHPDARVHPLAVLIGDVEVRAGALVYPKSVIRGEDGPVVIGQNAIVMDGAVVDALGVGVTLGDASIASPKCVLYGCVVGKGSLLGPHTIVLERAVVGEGSVTTKGSLLGPDFEAPERSWLGGVPATVQRQVGEGDLADLEKQRQALRARYDEHGSWVGLDAEGKL